MTMSEQSPGPTLLRWAMMLALVQGLGQFVIAAAYYGVLPVVAEELRIEGPSALFGGLCVVLGVVLAVGALGLLGRTLWSWRLSVAAMSIAACSHAFRHQWYGLVLGLVAVALLFMGLQEVLPPCGTPADQVSADLEDRSIRRARRRLTPDEASLRGISLVDRHPSEGPAAKS